MAERTELFFTNESNIFVTIHLRMKKMQCMLPYLLPFGIMLCLTNSACAIENQAHLDAIKKYEKHCPATAKGETVTLHEIKIRKKKGFKIIPTIVSSKAKPHIEMDINGDQLMDRILIYVGACGNYGDCPYAILAGCGSNVYKMVWKPEYAAELKVLKSKSRDRSGLQWFDVQLFHSTGKKSSTQILHFKDGVYRIKKLK